MICSRANGGLLSKPSLKGVSLIQLPPPTKEGQSGGSGVGTPVAEIVDRKELEELHSSVGAFKEDGKPRRRSIGEGFGQTEKG